MNEALQIIFIVSLLLGIVKGLYKLSPSSALSTKEPDIYFVITDFHK